MGNDLEEDHLPGEKSPVLSFFVVLIMSFGGAGAGVGLAHLLAPDSEIAHALGFIAFAGAFLASMALWQGIALIFLLVKFLFRLSKGRRVQTREALVALRRKALVMPPVCFFIIVPAGPVIGWLGGSFLLATGVFALAGLTYGLAMWGLAQRDLLPLMED